MLDPTATTTPGRASGIIIAVSSVLAIAFVAHHPMDGGLAKSDVLASIDQIRTIDHAVHGALIALLLGFMTGFAGFVDQSGPAKPAMRAGLLLYMAGCLGGIAAGLLDGFIVPDIAKHFLAGPPDEQKIAYDLIVFAGLCIQSLSRFAFIMMSAGILVWAVTLLAQSPARWFAAIVGLLAGGIPATILLATSIILRPPELVAILAAQATWNACVAWMLIQRRTNRQRA